MSLNPLVWLETLVSWVLVSFHSLTSSVFDADSGVNHEKTEVRNQDGEVLGADLWTGCYTPRELRLMLEKAKMNVRDIFSVDPGAYADAVPSLETSEYLVIAFPSPSQPEGAC